MSERKVLTKYYPPDFDPSKITRTRLPKGEKAGPKVQTVRLMAPFSMRCTSCGEYIYKGRKFNARKETTDEKYYSISIFRFYIRCTRCSGEITFKTDPKNMDYTCERGAKRNFEVWRKTDEEVEESDEARLDRLERDEAEMAGVEAETGKSKMEELESRTEEARTEMRIADALDEIRMKNARVERGEKGDMEGVLAAMEDRDKERQLEKEQLERELEEEARRAFRDSEGDRVRRIVEEEDDTTEGLGGVDFAVGGSASGEPKKDTSMPPPSFARNAKAKKKKEPFGGLGIKKKAALV